MGHIILFIQPSESPQTRTYGHYVSVEECLEGMSQIFEDHLKRQNPYVPSITYDISQLFDFIDQLVDLCCLVYRSSDKTYVPHNKQWIKDRIYEQMSKAAGI